MINTYVFTYFENIRSTQIIQNIILRYIRQGDANQTSSLKFLFDKYMITLNIGLVLILVTL